MLEKKNWVEGTFTFSFLLTIIHRNSSQYWIVNDFFYYGLGSPLWSYLDIYVTNLGNKGQNLVHTQKHLITLHFFTKDLRKGRWLDPAPGLSFLPLGGWWSLIGVQSLYLLPLGSNHHTLAHLELCTAPGNREFFLWNPSILFLFSPSEGPLGATTTASNSPGVVVPMIWTFGAKREHFLSRRFWIANHFSVLLFYRLFPSGHQRLHHHKVQLLNHWLIQISQLALRNCQRSKMFRSSDLHSHHISELGISFN